MRRSRTEETVAVLATPVATELGLELVGVEFVKERGKWFLRLYIDREGGVGLEDCEHMSRAIDKVLDEADPVPESYYLEVSSPGLERPLSRLSDFVRFAGARAVVKTDAPIDGRRKFDGKIHGVDGDIVLMDVGAGSPVAVPFSSVVKANLVFEW